MFHIAVTVAVLHDDRDVEFHDLAEAVQLSACLLGVPVEGGGLDFGSQSCERLAMRLLSMLRDSGFAVLEVCWSEDGEFDAVVAA